MQQAQFQEAMRIQMAMKKRHKEGEVSAATMGLRSKPSTIAQEPFDLPPRED